MLAIQLLYNVFLFLVHVSPCRIHIFVSKNDQICFSFSLPKLWTMIRVLFYSTISQSSLQKMPERRRKKNNNDRCFLFKIVAYKLHELRRFGGIKKRENKCTAIFRCLFSHFLSLICLSQIAHILVLCLALVLATTAHFSPAKHSRTFFFLTIHFPKLSFYVNGKNAMCTENSCCATFESKWRTDDMRKTSIMKEKNSFYAWLRHNKNDHGTI